MSKMSSSAFPSLSTLAGLVALVALVALSGVDRADGASCKEATDKCDKEPGCKEKFDKSAEACDTFADFECKKKSDPECKKAATELKKMPLSAELKSCTCPPTKPLCKLIPLTVKTTLSCVS